ncbi:hypothetical protein B0H10DRAFT_2236468 [Mycena sp. CBHHK59/15]|nr:hypothetical protein B0H10DRAFT_2236468 [Mycena sp. CBHHK59/15]
MSNTNNVLQIPMPSSRGSGAPCFEGKEVTGFLTSIVQHGANAGITDIDQLVPYILQYSTEPIRALIRYMPEFDPEITGKTWNAAKDQLLLLYGHSERVPDYTETMLRDFCEKQSAKPSFVNMADIEVYYRAFALIAVPLVKKAKISTKERDFYFIAGIPKVIKDWFLTQVPDAKRKRSDPPSVAESIGYLKKRFDDDSLTFEPWTEDAKASPIPHELSSAVTTNHLSAVDDLARQLERLTSAPTASVPTTPSNPVDELARQLERLALQLTTFSGNGIKAKGLPKAEAFSALAERRHVNRSLIHDRVVEISPLAYTASPLVQKVHQALDIEWGKEMGARFDPLKRPDNKGKNRDTPPHMDRAPEDGWKAARPSNQKTDDVIMRDAKKPAQTEKYHITSDIQERADAKAVFDTSATPEAIYGIHAFA